MRKISVGAVLFALVAALPLWAAPVTFNNADLAAAVRTQWQAATGETLSTPPEDTELADSRFTTLVLRNASVDDLTGLEACTSLTKLDLAFNTIADLTPLAGLTNLTYLELGFGDLLNEDNGGPQPNANLITDISPLGGLVNLEYLNVAGNADLADISPLSTMDNLQRLWLGFNNLSDFSPLADVADTLTFFVSIMAGMTNADLTYVAAMTNLTALGFYGEEDIDDLSPLTGLNPSMFICGFMPVTDISVVANFTNLSMIMLESLGITDLDDLVGHSSLQQVNANNCQITDISGLDGLTGIEGLSLENNQIVDISALASLTGLRELSLESNQITDIQALLDNTGLGGDDRIRLNNNPLSETAACDQLPQFRTRFNSSDRVEANAVCGPAVNLTINTNGPGETWPEPGTYQYATGSSVSINAKPEVGSGYAFDHWEGDVPAGQDSTNMSIQIGMDADKSITAVFTSQIDYTLTIVKAGPAANSGRTEPDAGVSSYKANQQVYLNFDANDGSNAYFAGWSGDVAGYGSRQLVMDSNKNVTATFLNSGYKLRVNTSGNGGIDNFNTNKDLLLASGAALNLLAVGWNGSRFDHWEGDVPDGVSNTANPLPVTMNQERNLTAVFLSGDRVLTIAVGGEGAGTTQPSPGTYNYFDGDYVYINALASGSSAFVRWEGDIGSASTTNPNLQLLMNQNRNVTAIFGTAAWTLTVQMIGNGDTDPNPGSYGYGNNVQTNVYANILSGGDAFDRWVGDISSNNATDTYQQITMDRNRTVTAQFVPGDYTLTFSKAGPGCGNPYPNAGTYAYLAGRTAYLNANVCNGSYFAGWSGDASGYAANVSVLMNDNKAVTANYATSGYNLTLSVDGQGWTNLNPGTIGYAEDAVITLTANGAPQGWVFDTWMGDLPEGADSSAQSIDITMDQDRSITAKFTEQPPASLTIIIEGTGETNPAGAASPGNAYTYNLGDQAYLEALQGENGWAFSHWSGDIGGSNATDSRITLYMDQDRTVIAHYMTADYNLTISYTGNGSTWPEPGVYGYMNGSEAEFGANLISGGDAFDGWTGDWPDGEDPQETHHRIIMNQDRTLTAVFVPGDWNLTITGIAGGGSAYQDPQPGVYGYINGRTARAEVRLNDGSFWGGWTGDVTSFDTLLRFTITSNATVTPNVATTGYYLTVAPSDVALGETEPQGSNGYAAGTVVPVSATGKDNGFFTNWTGDLPSGADAESSTINVLMDQNRALTANFAEYDWYLFLQVQGQGSLDPAAGIHWYNDGDVVTVTATPADGYAFYMWDGLLPAEGDATSSTVDITVNTDRIVTANFVPSAINVPDLAAMTQQQAENALLAIGLRLGEVTQANDETVPEGQVISQNPAAGEAVAYGSAVAIVVSLGPSTGDGEGGGEEGDGEGGELGPHSADQDANHIISLTELLRVIQFFNTGGFHCVTPPATSEDGYLAGPGDDHSCAPHSSDYNPQNWQISLTELLRLIQFFNTGGYHECPGTGTEDDYCVGPPTA